MRRFGDLSSGCQPAAATTPASSFRRRPRPVMKYGGRKRGNPWELASIVAGKVGRVILGAFLAENKAGLTPAGPVEAGRIAQGETRMTDTEPRWSPPDTAALVALSVLALWATLYAVLAVLA